MKDKVGDKRDGERRDDLRALAESMTKRPARGNSVDAMSLESRRRAIAYGRARGNA